jgi:hypothetical protein
MVAGCVRGLCVVCQDAAASFLAVLLSRPQSRCSSSSSSSARTVAMALSATGGPLPPRDAAVTTAGRRCCCCCAGATTRSNRGAAQTAVLPPSTLVVKGRADAVPAAANELARCNCMVCMVVVGKNDLALSVEFCLLASLRRKKRIYNLIQRYYGPSFAFACEFCGEETSIQYKPLSLHTNRYPVESNYI